MSELIKSIIETEKIKELIPDFSVLEKIPKEVAEKAQTLIFWINEKKSIQNTNNK